MNVSTYKTYVKGAHLLIDGDRTRRYTGLIPKISPRRDPHDRAGAVEDRPHGEVRCRSTRRGPRTARRSGTRIRSRWWLERSGIRSAIGRDLFEMAVQGLFPGDLNDVSFLNLLFLAKAHGSLGALFSIERRRRRRTWSTAAPGRWPTAWRPSSGDAVRLDAPVRSITQHDDHVTVESRRSSRSRRATPW